MPIQEEEVKWAIKNSDTNKSAGLDDIPPALLCEQSGELVRVIAHIFNLILATGEFPATWKQDRRIPIHKGGRKSDVDRPLQTNSDPFSL